MGTSKTHSLLWFAAITAAIGAPALTEATQAADLGLTPPPIETWTGFSVGVGGGVEFLDADVNTRASREDKLGECRSGPLPGLPLGQNGGTLTLADFADAPCDVVFTLPAPIFTQRATSNRTDLNETGGFFTVQGAYDYQFAPRWVAGAFVDADWSGTDAHARQTQTSPPGPQFFDGATVAFAFGEEKTTFDTRISTDWRISVGGRFGWLATPNTLLYFLAAYTHQELSDARVKISITDPLLAIGSPNPLSDSPTSLLVKLPDSLDGFSLGGGGEVKLGGPWGVKLEYRWMHFNGGSGRASSKTFNSVAYSLEPDSQNNVTRAPLYFHDVNSQASAKLDDVDIQTVRAVLTYHFWSGGGYGG